jgi:hypothetical protein
VNLENPSAAVGCAMALLAAGAAAAIIFAFFWFRAVLTNRRKLRLASRYGERRNCIESTAYRFLASVAATSYALSCSDDASLLKVVIVDAATEDVKTRLDSALSDAGCPVKTIVEFTTSEQVMNEVGRKTK